MKQNFALAALAIGAVLFGVSAVRSQEPQPSPSPAAAADTPSFPGRSSW